MKQGAQGQEVGIDQLVGRWVLNSSESEVRFTEPTLWGLVKVKGRFTTFGGSGAIEPGGTVTGSVQIEAASLDTNNKKRDEHLRSSDFFDVERHPLITVDVSSVAIRGEAADIHAALAIRGVPEPITLTASVEDVTADRVHLKAQAKVDRGRFGMTWRKMGATAGHHQGRRRVPPVSRVTAAPASWRVQDELLVGFVLLEPPMGFGRLLHRDMPLAAKAKRA